MRCYLIAARINWWKSKVENNTCSHNLALRLQECLVRQKRPVWFHHLHACHTRQIYTKVRSIFWVSSNFDDVFRKRPSMTTYYSEEVPSHQQQMHSYMHLSWNPNDVIDDRPFLQTAVGFQFYTVIHSIFWTWLKFTDAFSKSPSTVTINLKKSLLINSKCTDRCVNLKCQRMLMMSDHFSSLQLGWQLWLR